MLPWFGYVERMEEERLVKKTTRSDVRGVRLRRKPRMGWMDSVKEPLDAREGRLWSKEERLRLIEMNAEHL